jgi:uncharacterized SAM-dependent methyltransferase
MMPEPEKDPRIFDIRHDYENLHLKGDVINGLATQPRTLPSLLLWNDQGQKLFDILSKTPNYYPFHSEMKILSQHGMEIGRNVPQDGALLELGCG